LFRLITAVSQYVNKEERCINSANTSVTCRDGNFVRQFFSNLFHSYLKKDFVFSCFRLDQKNQNCIQIILHKNKNGDENKNVHKNEDKHKIKMSTCLLIEYFGSVVLFSPQ